MMKRMLITPVIFISFMNFTVAACSSRPGRPHGLGSIYSSSQKSGDSSATDGKTGSTSANDAALHVVDARSNLRINNLEVLINKLKVVTGLDEKADAIQLARKSFALLGGYDYSQGILPENLWNSDKMSAWYKVVDGICQDPGLIARLQKAGGEKDFLESAYGRDQTADETGLLAAIKITGTHRARIVCSVVLSSGEFVSL